MSYCGVLLDNPKCKSNSGAILRSSDAFGVDFIYVLDREGRSKADLYEIETNVWNSHTDIPVFYIENIKDIEFNCPLVGVEITEESKCITNHSHLNQCIYCFGPEDGDLSIQGECNELIEIPSEKCLNLAHSVTTVLYDRKID